MASEITRRSFMPSALNLAHYLALRSRDLRQLRAALVPWGLSSLGRSEARAMPSLDAVIATLGTIVGGRQKTNLKHPSALAHRARQHRLAANTDELSGRRSGERRVRIMVTMSAAAAGNVAAVRELVARGMDCARINCAHDTPAPVEAVRLTDPNRRVMPGETILLRHCSSREGTTDQSVPFEIVSSVAAVFDALAPGHRVYIDGGKIDATVEAIVPDGAILRVKRTGAKGGKLAREKAEPKSSDEQRRMGVLDAVHATGPKPAC